MSSRRFRLEAVLRVRRIQEEAERGSLRLAHAARDLARAGEEEARAHYRVVPQTTGASDLAEFMAERASALRAAESVALRHRDLVAAEVAVEKSRRCWSEAAARVSMLERLEDRHRRAHQADVDRREIQAVEELTSARSLRARAAVEAQTAHSVPGTRALSLPAAPSASEQGVGRR